MIWDPGQSIILTISELELAFFSKIMESESTKKKLKLLFSLDSKIQGEGKQPNG